MRAPEADGMMRGGTARQRAFGIAFALLILAFLGLAVLWSQRMPIAERFVQRELDALDVRTSYKVSQVAVRTQRIENLVLGDPARPDLTARSVEVDIVYGGLLPRVGAVRARGVRIHGRITDKGLSLGELDKFRDPTSTAPFGMPDVDLTLDDARIRLETPAGPLGLVVNGSGNLQSGFAGKAAALMRNVSFGGCEVPRASAWLDVQITDKSPRLAGPVRADALRCAGGTAGAARLALRADVTLSPELDRWSGQVAGGAEAARGGGATVAGPRVTMRFDGDARAMQGRGRLAARALGWGAIGSGRTEVSGNWVLRDGRIAGDGRVASVDVRGIDVRGLRSAARNTASTPVGPLLDRLTDGIAALQTDNDLKGAFRFVPARAGSGGTVRLSDLELAGRKGGRVALSSGGSIAISLPDGRWTFDGALTSGGGGLPELALRARQATGGGFSGQMFVQPYAAGSARLDFDTVRISARPGGGTRIATRMRLDGPVAGGQLRGLEMPLMADWGVGGLVVNPSCAAMRFASLTTGTVALDGANMQLCPVDGALFALRDGSISGGGTLVAPRLTGQVGGTPLRLAAQSARYGLESGGFELTGADMRLGADEAPVILTASRLQGGARTRGLDGQAQGIAARIGTVPLLVRDGDARWALVDGALALKGSLILYDDANPDRFNPLQSSDFRLTLANGRVDADGTLHLPGGDRTIASVKVRHLLGPGTGSADLAVDDLRFDKRLQPDEITHIALGVVANVEGVLNGRGRIDWTPQSVTSSGEFATSGTNLAAAFGPVQGLSTRVRFTDLLGLVTAPGQEMRLASVHPGIEVRDGVIRYALLPGQRVAIESGRWPFAGGELLLLPSVMDMSAEQPRRLTFRVLGLDAGSFIQTLELENVFATGTFDGLLPMVFDADGGRIQGGILTARQVGMPPLVINHVERLSIPCDRDRQGGRLSYVGQVSNENLGRFGRLAFDALKDLQYKCLTVLMDGAIDGEVVTQVTFNGVNRGELSSVPKPIAAQFVGLPFIFNITIAAPFRGLINTARSFVDPSLLIRQHLGDQFAPAVAPQNRLAVQPGESETMPTRGRE